MKYLLNILAQLAFTFFLYGIGIMVISTALMPSIWMCFQVWKHTSLWGLEWQVVGLTAAVVAGYFLFGIILIFIVGLVRILFNLKLQEGEYKLASAGAFKWALTNSLVLVVSNLFMDFILLTPFINLFYRLMGAKLGKNVQINSKFCADLSLLEIGDDSVIGGHATVIGHSVERGRIILKKVKIGKRVVIGLNSVVLPGADIGDGSILAAGTVLGKNATIEPRSVYFGVPGMSVKERNQKEHV